ncbi:MAG: FAD-dependent oxidoreductase [Lachnospiraceae bacterium]|nr:FAD-dependent oxidoreductase [Lachnospiraceae bacterium]
MENIKVPEKEVPVVKETDVIVIGGGVAGVAAAVAAARQGVKVTLIEKSIVLGGLATSGHVCVYLPIDDGNGNKVYGGLAEELLHICIRYSQNNLPEVWKSKPDTAPPDSERYMANFFIPHAVLSLDEFTEKEGVDVVFDAVFSEPIMEGNTVKGVIVESKSGRTAYMAKMFVDASGDADLVYRAGADTETLKTIVSHWFHELDFDIMKRGIEEKNMLRAVPMRWLGLVPSGGAGDENEELTCDGTTTEGVNEYIRKSRGLALDFLKNNLREDFAMISLPFMPQFRMTRRLVGNDELKYDDEYTIESSVGCVIASLDKPATVYEFPYEGLITDKLSNVLAAGRMVSASGRGWAIMRFIPACVLTGEASGTAAALAVKDGCTVQELDVKKLQKVLSDNGVKLHRTKAMEGNKPQVWTLNQPKEDSDEPVINKFCVHVDNKGYRLAGSKPDEH